MPFYMGCIRCGFIETPPQHHICPDCGDILCGALNPTVLHSEGAGAMQRKYRREHDLPPLPPVRHKHTTPKQSKR